MIAIIVTTRVQVCFAEFNLVFVWYLLFYAWIIFYATRIHFRRKNSSCLIRNVNVVVPPCLPRHSPSLVSRNWQWSVDNIVHLHLVLDVLLPTSRSIIVGSYDRYGLPWMYSKFLTPIHRIWLFHINHKFKI